MNNYEQDANVILKMTKVVHPDYVVNSIATFLKERDTKQKLQQHGVMQVPQFDELLQVRLEELPYTKHLDDGQHNDGQAYGFECGARWAYEKLSSGTTVGQRSVGQSGSDGIWCKYIRDKRCECESDSECTLL